MRSTGCTRRILLKTQVSRSGPLTVEGAVERRALLTYAVEDAGVGAAGVRPPGFGQVACAAAVLANEHSDGSTLAELDGQLADDQLRRVWDAVLRLHRHRVTHRKLTADHILFTRPDGDPGSDNGGEVLLLEPGDGDVAASDLQLRLDRVQLLAAIIIAVDPDF